MIIVYNGSNIYVNIVISPAGTKNRHKITTNAKIKQY